MNEEKNAKPILVERTRSKNFGLHMNADDFEKEVSAK